MKILIPSFDSFAPTDGIDHPNIFLKRPDPNTPHFRPLAVLIVRWVLGAWHPQCPGLRSNFAIASIVQPQYMCGFILFMVHPTNNDLPSSPGIGWTEDAR